MQGAAGSRQQPAVSLSGLQIKADVAVPDDATLHLAANLPSFDQVYSQLNDQRVNSAARRYLRDLRRDAVVDYR